METTSTHQHNTIMNTIKFKVISGTFDNFIADNFYITCTSIPGITSDSLSGGKWRIELLNVVTPKSYRATLISEFPKLSPSNVPVLICMFNFVSDLEWQIESVHKILEFNITNVSASIEI